MKTFKTSVYTFQRAHLPALISLPFSLFNLYFFTSILR